MRCRHFPRTARREPEEIQDLPLFLGGQLPQPSWVKQDVAPELGGAIGPKRLYDPYPRANHGTGQD
jgi:hypothetical protein